MSQIVWVIVNSEGAARLASVVADRSGSLKHIQRAELLVTVGAHVQVDALLVQIEVG